MQASITHTTPITRICTRERIPRMADSRTVAVTRSTTQPARNAAAYSTGDSRTLPWKGPAATSTAAGPRVCQASEMAKNTRSGSALRTAASTSVPSTRLQAVSSGTAPGGSSSSIGTSTM